MPRALHVWPRVIFVVESGGGMSPTAPDYKAMQCPLRFSTLSLLAAFTEYPGATLTERG